MSLICLGDCSTLETPQLLKSWPRSLQTIRLSKALGAEVNRGIVLSTVIVGGRGMRDVCSRSEAFTLRPVEFLAGLRIKHPR